MSITLHWDFMKHTGVIRNAEGPGSEARIHALMNIIGRANHRMRAWPSVEGIMAETGFTNRNAISAAIQWLFDHGAIYNVPTDYRVGAEKKVHHKQYVYQLTGVLKVGDKVFPYLHFTDEVYEFILEELAELGAENAIALHQQVEKWPKQAPVIEVQVEESTEDSYVPETDTQELDDDLMYRKPIRNNVPESDTLPGCYVSEMSGEVLYQKEDSCPASGPAADSSAPSGAFVPRLADFYDGGAPDRNQPEQSSDDDSVILTRALCEKLVELNHNKPLTAKAIKILKRQHTTTTDYDGVQHKYPSLPDLYDNEPGFANFVEDRFTALMQFARSKNRTFKMDDFVAHLTNLHKQEGMVGWLVWKEQNPEACAPAQAESKQEERVWVERPLPPSY